MRVFIRPSDLRSLSEELKLKSNELKAITDSIKKKLIDFGLDLAFEDMQRQREQCDIRDFEERFNQSTEKVFIRYYNMLIF